MQSFAWSQSSGSVGQLLSSNFSGPITGQLASRGTGLIRLIVQLSVGMGVFKIIDSIRPGTSKSVDATIFGWF